MKPPLVDSLMPIYFQPRELTWDANRVVSFGANGDSFYEYLLKASAQRQHDPHFSVLLTLWGGTMDDMVRAPPTHRGLCCIGEGERRERMRRCKRRSRIVTLGTGDRKWSLNDGQIPNSRVGHVALGMGYNRIEGNRRASRNGLVSDLPLRFATFASLHSRRGRGRP